MLKAYVDDCEMGKAPVSVLAGWLADSSKWARFSDDWKDALEMRPRLEYFKYSEAKSFGGQFSGWSEQSRNDRIRRLMAILVEYSPLGVVSAMPHDLYQGVFGKNEDKIVRYPYFFCFYSIVVGITQYLALYNKIEPVDFIFDVQPGQMDAVVGSWERLLEVAPSEVRPILGDYPIFRSDKTTMPLQAADLCAGYQREQAMDALAGAEESMPLWGEMGTGLQRIGRLWTIELIREMRDGMLRRAASGEQSS
jgi:hypothetical protein